MFNQKSVKWSFLIASVLILAACGEVGPNPSLSSISPSSSTPNSISQSSSSSSSSPPSSSSFSSSSSSSSSGFSGSSSVTSISSASSSTPNSISQSSSSSSSSQPPVQYTITFKNYDDSVLSTQTSNQGSTVVYSGPTPTKPSTSQYTYTFTGWDKNLTNVTSSFSTIAQYSSTINSYTITWQNHDGTTLETDNNVPYGTIPTYNGQTPTKTSSDEYDFTFTGWSTEVVSVVGNATYIAQFTQNLNYIPITTAQELNNIRNNLSGSYRLMNDIDLESNEWTPIGTDTAPFTGTLDGKDFTINNLKISTSQVYVGLIGYNEGTIKNLKLDNVDINVTGGLSSNIYGGAFIGYNNSSSEIENLQTLSGDIYIKKRGDNLGYLGGIVGYQNNSITFISVSNSLTVNGDTTNATGGLVGFNKNQLIIQNNKNLGNINGLNTTKKVGGFIGESYQLTLTGSINSGSVSGTESVGGFVGKGMANITIENSINEALISGTAWNIGGFLGEMQYGTLVVNDSHNKGNILASQSLGGIIGTGGKIILNNTFNLGNISGTGTVYSTAGGLIGYGSQAILYKSYNRGDVFGYGWFVGGLIAWSIGSVTEITSSYNFGNISGKSYTGGIIGREVTGLRIINSYNTGEVMAISKVGGIVGSTGYATFFEGVINIGDVNAQNDVGGLIGEAEYSLVALHSVNFGLVLASNTTLNIGGITGKLPSNNDIEQTYYSGSITSNGVEVDGVAFGTKVTDLTTFNLAFFTTTLGWDTEIWDFTGLDVANGVYPTLKNMPEIPVEE